jgi:HEAT repeat protein
MRRPLTDSKLFIVALALLGALVTGRVARAQQEESPAVETLRKALMLPIGGNNGQVSAEEKRERKNRLETAVKPLTLADLLPTLGLAEWRDEDRVEDIAIIDRPIRGALIDRLIEECKNELAKGSRDRKLALLNQIGALGSKIHGQELRVPIGSLLAPTVIASLNDPAPEVVAAAARTLGSISSEPEPAAEALGKLLSHKEASVRRGASAGLVSMLHRAVFALKAEQNGLPVPGIRRGERGLNVEAGVETAPAGLIARAVLPPVKKGIGDPDVEVRRKSLEAARIAADLVGFQATPPGNGFVPEGPMGPNGEENPAVKQYRESVEALLKGLQPQVDALRGTIPAIIAQLKDDDGKNRELACRALEGAMIARRRVEQLRTSVPGAKPPPQKLPPEDLLVSLRDALPALAALLSHKDVESRLAALYALEEYRADTATVADAVAKLSNDADPFVRWAGVRVIDGMAPQQPAVVVPSLVKGLSDPSGDVRLAAMVALKHYGPAAEIAGADLAKAINKGDPDTRILVIQALVAISKPSEPAGAALVEALSAPSSRVRLEAARALGKFKTGPKTVEALRKALDDSDPEVRSAAAESLLRTTE